MARSQRFLYVLCVPHFASHSQKSMDKITQFNLLTEQTLPTRARELHWPIRLDHCFKRICLDHAFQAPWHTKIPRPAYRHLTGDPSPEPSPAPNPSPPALASFSTASTANP